MGFVHYEKLALSFPWAWICDNGGWEQVSSATGHQKNLNLLGGGGVVSQDEDGDREPVSSDNNHSDVVQGMTAKKG
jgi:hypothetical protein